MELSRHDTGSGSPPIDPNYFNFVMGHLPPRKTPSNVGDWTLRVVHFPESSPESAWDIHYQNGVGEIHQIRFQQSAKDFFQAEPSKQVVTERGQAKLVENEPLVIEVQNGLCLDCHNFQDTQSGGDYYILNFQYGEEVHTAYASNPRRSSMEDAEPWQRLLTRLVGSSLLVQRKVHLG